jgi:hypothetical protein
MIRHEVTGGTDPIRVKRPEAVETYAEDAISSELSLALAFTWFYKSARADVHVGVDVAVIMVPTPLRDSQRELAYVEEASPKASASKCFSRASR